MIAVTTWIAGYLIRSTVIFATALLLAFLLRRRKPLIASAVLNGTFVVLLILPVVYLLGPRSTVSIGTKKDVRTEAVPQLSDDNIQSVPAVLPEASREFVAWQIEEKQEAEQPAAIASSGSEGSANVGNWAPLQASIPTLLVCVYGCGVAVGLYRLMSGWIYIGRLQHETDASSEWKGNLLNCQQRIGLTREIRIMESDKISIPLTFGWLRPVILVPSSVRTIDNDTCHAILIHELAHIYRNDFFWLILWRFVEAVYWCHPLMWIVRLMDQPLREQTCDDVCIHVLKNKELYRQSILQIAANCVRPATSLGLAMAQAGKLRQRLIHIATSEGNASCCAPLSLRQSFHVVLLLFVWAVGTIDFVDRPLNAQNNQTQDGPKLLRLTGEEISSAERKIAASANHNEYPSSVIGILGSGKLSTWQYSSEVAFTDKGRQLVSADGHGSIRFWKRQTGELLKHLWADCPWEHGPKHISALDISPDGKQIATSHHYGIRLWDIHQEKLLQLWRTDQQVFDVEFHPTRPLLATGEAGVAKLWNLDTGQVVHVLKSQEPSFRRQFVTDNVIVKFLKQRDLLVVGHPEGSVQFWNTKTGRLDSKFRAHDQAIADLAIEESKKLMATADRDGTLRIWSLDGPLLHEIKAHDELIYSLEFHPTEPYLFSGGYGFIRKWNTQNGQQVETFGERQSGPMASLSVDATSHTVASGGSTIGLWNADDGASAIQLEGHRGQVNRLCFSRSKNRLYSVGNDHTVRVWNLNSGKSLVVERVPKSMLTSIAVGPDGSSFAASSRFRGKLIYRGNVDYDWDLEGAMSGDVAISDDGRRLAVFHHNRVDGSINLYDLKTGDIDFRIATQASNGRVFFTPDSKNVVLAGTSSPAQNQCYLAGWNIETRKPIFQIDDLHDVTGIRASSMFRQQPVIAVFGRAFDDANQPHGRIVLWNWKEQKVASVLELGHHAPNAMDVSPDEKSIVTIDSRAGIAKVWDTRDLSERESHRLCRGGSFFMQDVQFATDSRHFATAMGNGTIYISRIQSPPKVRTPTVQIPERFEESPEKPWLELVDSTAPELSTDNFLFGAKTKIQSLQGKWVAIYFWNQGSEQDIPSWINLHDRLNEALEIIVVKGFDGNLPQEQGALNVLRDEWWAGRTPPFRFALDKRKETTISGTRIQAIGPTYAIFKIPTVRRGSSAPPVALLIDPTGKVIQELPRRPNRRTIPELANLMGIRAATPDWEIDTHRESRLAGDQAIRLVKPPFSEARRQHHRLILNFSAGDSTAVFAQSEDQLRWRSFHSEDSLSIARIMEQVIGIPSYQIAVDPILSKEKLKGDWTVRDESAEVDRILQFEKILNEETKQSIAIRLKTVQSKHIVVSGKWNPKPINEADDVSVYFSLDDVTSPKTFGVGGSTGFDEMLDWFGKRLEIKFENKVETPPNAPIKWKEINLVQHLGDIHSHNEAGQKKLNDLLQRLDQQTGLDFQLTKKKVTVWSVGTEQ